MSVRVILRIVLIFLAILVVGELGYYFYLSRKPTPITFWQQTGPLPAPTQLLTEYPHATRYTGTLQSQSANTLILSTINGNLTFTWDSGPKKENTSFFHRGAKNELSYMSKDEFLQLLRGTKLEILANSETMHAYQVHEYK